MQRNETDHQMPLDWGSFKLLGIEIKRKKKNGKDLPLAFNLQHDKSRKRAACMQHASAQTFWPRPQPQPQLRLKHKFPLTINLKEITLKWKWPGAKFSRKAEQRTVTGESKRAVAGQDLGSWAAARATSSAPSTSTRPTAHGQAHRRLCHWHCLPNSDSRLCLPNSCLLTSYPASAATTFGCTVFQQFGKQMRAHHQMNAQINKTTS